MKYLLLKSKKIFFTVVLSFLFGSLYSQDDVTSYYLRSIPQASYSNPAFFPDCKWHFGVPGFSSLYFGVGNSGFSFNDVAEVREDSMYLKLNEMLSKLRKKNQLYVDFKEELLSFGFKKRRNYFSFSASTKFSYKFGYPKDLFAFAIKGNGSYLNQTMFFDGIGVDLFHYNEYGFGFSRKFNGQISAGIKAKYIQGLANIYSRSTDISLFTQEKTYDLSVTSDININSSIPQQIYLYDSLGYYDDFDKEYNLNDSTSTKTDQEKYIYASKYYLLNNKNKGFGIDLGVNYIFDPRFSASISVVDFGYIFWKKHTQSFTNTIDSLKFEGIDFITFFNKTDSIREKQLQNLADSFVNKFQIEKNTNYYTTPLNTKLYIGASYKLRTNSSIGALFRAEFYKKAFYPSLTLSYNQKFNNIFSLSGTYSISRISYYNVGFGASTTLGPWQLYLISDNPLALLLPYDTKNINVRIGMNFVFGRKQKKSIPSIRRSSYNAPTI